MISIQFGKEYKDNEWFRRCSQIPSSKPRMKCYLCESNSHNSSKCPLRYCVTCHTYGHGPKLCVYHKKERHFRFSDSSGIHRNFTCNWRNRRKSNGSNESDMS